MNRFHRLFASKFTRPGASPVVLAPHSGGNIDTMELPSGNLGGYDADMTRSFDETQALSSFIPTEPAHEVAERVGVARRERVLMGLLGASVLLLAGLCAHTALFLRAPVLALMLALAALLTGYGLLLVVSLAHERLRRRQAEEAQRLETLEQHREGRRINDTNQAAILRLMNELQTVAKGDLTRQATVSDDITGAIADSVNYTVDALRSLVGNVQSAARRVAHTTAAVDDTSTELLAASAEQLREIRATGQAVLDMATRISQVSAQAQESASVARQSLAAASSGLSAVGNAIGGMHSIRGQIQETAKRIKRLGESSQQIGEITDLISGITEQTKLLAMNAAIQAAAGGTAARGFSMVAEEVQRLAARSAEATRQIGQLVRTIQIDTHDAIAAMERSTHNVVEGARLSDYAGTALGEIDGVSRRLAELIGQMSATAAQEAASANRLTRHIQHIFAVTEQTSDGTRSTARQVRELSQIAEELRHSVSRFKIS